MIKAALISGLSGVRALLGDLSEAVNEASHDTTKDSAEWMVRTVQQRIIRQQYPHKPLNRAYLRRKIREGWDPRILIRSGAYVTSIGIIDTQVEERPGGKRGQRVTFTVGVPDEKHPMAKLTYAQLGMIHEFGTNTISARPHWRPVWKEAQDREGKKRMKRVAASLRRFITKRTQRITSNVLQQTKGFFKKGK